MATREQVVAALEQALNDGNQELAAEYGEILRKMAGQPEELPDYGLGSAVRHGLQQGATFGFADEASAFGRALLDPLMDRLTGVPEEFRGGDQSFMDRYRMYRDDERQQIAAGRQHHGGAMLAAEFAPGILQAGAGLLGRGAQAGGRAALDQLAQRTLGQNVARGAGVGAGYGALAGAGYSEADDLTGMMRDIGIGTALGGGMGGAFPLVGAGAQRAWQATGGRLRPGVTTQGAQDAATLRARRELEEALSRDRLTPDELARAFRDDPDAFLMDLGPHVRQLGKLTARQVGEGGERIVENVTRRQELANQRLRPGMRGFIKQAFQSEDSYLPENFARHERDIMRRGRQIADDRGLWELAYRGDYRAPRSMLEFLRTRNGKILNADARQADAVARRNLQRRLTMGEIQPNDPGMLARYHEEVLRALKGNIKLSQNPVSATAKIGQETALMLRQHKTLLDDFTRAMPDEWAEARRLWAGTQANREAYQAGNKVLTEYADDVALRFQEMSMSEVDNYLVGALRRIEHELATKGDTTDILRRLRGSEHGRQIMRMLAGDEANFQNFLRMAKREQNYLTTFRKVTGGSDTFENIMGAQGTAEAATLGGEVGTLMGIGMQNNSRWLRGIAGLPLFGRALGRRIGETLTRRDELKRDALANMLLSRDPTQLTQAMARPPLPSSPLMTLGGVAGATQLPGLLED